MLLALLTLHADNAEFNDNRLSVIKARKKFKSGNTEISLGGVVQPELSFRRQSQGNDVEGINPHFNIADTKLHFAAAHTTQSGWTLGYTLRLAPNVGKEKAEKEGEDKSGIQVDRNYAEVSHDKVGTFQLGHQKGAHDLLAKLAQKNMPTVWIDGGIDKHITNPSKDEFHTGNDLTGHTSNGLKINWLSPCWSGVKLGATYAMDTVTKGNGVRDYTKGERHHLTGVVSYQQKFGDMSVGVAGALLAACTNTKDKTRNTLSYMISASLGWKSFTLAAEWMDSLVSGLAEADAAQGNAGKAINVSLSYAINDKHSVGLGGQHTCHTMSETAKNYKNLATLGYTFKFVECATWYLEASYVCYHKKGADKAANSGGVLLTGLRFEI